MKKQDLSPKKSLEKLDQSQRQLWQLKEELGTYGGLLTNLNQDEIHNDKLFGLGLSLERISKKIGRINDRLGCIKLRIKRDVEEYNLEI